MENILNFCCEKNRQKTNESIVISTLPIEGIVAILFLNIAYTSNSNYRKWFYNTYKVKYNETIKRERRYSFHEDIDYDACMTDRKIKKNESIDSLYEELYLCKEPLNIYYIPFAQQLLPIFEKHIEYFDNNIISVKIPHGKIKFFEKNNIFFITFLFDKHLELSLVKNNKIMIGKNTLYINDITEEIINGFLNKQETLDILKKMIISEKTIISAHYKNCVFADLIVYQLLIRVRNPIIYFAIAPILGHNNILYKKINKKITYYLINHENPDNISTNFIKIKREYEPFCGSSINYRKNLKNITLEILYKFR